MFATPKDAIAYALGTSKGMFHRFLDDLKPHEFEHQPGQGMNNAVWIVGHLIRTDRRSLTWLGVTDLPEIPEGFEEQFQPSRAAATEQKGYGDPKQLIALFDTHRDRLIATVRTVPDAKLDEPPTIQTPFFTNKGEALLFMALHTSMHVGQITTIRRSLGYAPLA